MTQRRQPDMIDQVQASDQAALPPAILASIERHKARVAQLVTALRAAGMSEEVIHRSVRTVVASYEQELVKAIRDLEA